MEFIVFILNNFFKIDFEKATRIMFNVHKNGIGEGENYNL